MENENFESCSIDTSENKVPIRKAFNIIGLGLSFSIILMNLIQIIGVKFINNFFPQIAQSDYFVFGVSTIPLTIIAMPVLFAVTSFLPTTKTYYKSKISGKNLFKILVCSYIAMTILNIISQIMNIIISQLTGAKATNPLAIIQSTSILPTILFVVILSPIVEEIMFRYIIINKLRGYGSGVAIFASAFAFGLYHGNLYQMLYAFGLGIVFGAIVYKTGKLRYTIFLHIIINFIGTILPFGLMSDSIILKLLCLLVLGAISISGLVLGIITLCKTDYSKLKQDIMPKKYLKPFFLNVGTILFIILTIIAIVLFLIR